MLEWIKQKIENINTIVDLGVVLTIITVVTTLLIFSYKLTYLNILNVPFQISIKIININLIDYVFAFLSCVLVFGFGLLGYYNLYIEKLTKKIRNIFILAIIEVVVVFLISIFSGRVSSEAISYCVWILMSYIFTLFPIWIFNSRPKEVIERIFNDSNVNTKILVSVSETLSVLANIVIISMYLANVTTSIPAYKVIVDDKIVIYSLEDTFLVADFEYIDKNNGFKSLKIIDGTYEIVSKENKVDLTCHKVSITRK